MIRHPAHTIVEEPMDSIEAIRERLNAKRSGPPSPESLRAAIDALQKQLDSITTAMDSIDTRASIVPPIITGIGALTFFTGTASIGLPGVVLLLIAVAAGSAAFVCAYLAIQARDFSFGPEPEQIAAETSLDPVTYAQRQANSLVLVVQKAIGAIETKAEWFNRSLVAAGVSVVALLLFRLVSAVSGTPPAA